MEQFFANTSSGQLMHWDIPDNCFKCNEPDWAEITETNKSTFAQRVRCKHCHFVRWYDAKPGRK